MILQPNEELRRLKVDYWTDIKSYNVRLLHSELLLMDTFLLCCAAQR